MGVVEVLELSSFVDPHRLNNRGLVRGGFGAMPFHETPFFVTHHAKAGGRVRERIPACG